MIFFIVQDNEAKLEMILFESIISQTYYVENSTRRSFSFSLTCSLRIIDESKNNWIFNPFF